MRLWIILVTALLLSACGFHLRGHATFAPAVKRIYIKSRYPYTPFARELKTALKSSNARLADAQKAANITLTLIAEQKQQPMVTVGGSQQTQQYNLIFAVSFQLETRTGDIFYGPQTITEQRTQIVQPSQILSDTNDTQNLYNVMYRDAAHDLLEILTSGAVTKAIDKALTKPVKLPTPKPIIAKPLPKKPVAPPKPSAPVTPDTLPAEPDLTPVPAQKTPSTTEVNSVQ